MNRFAVHDESMKRKRGEKENNILGKGRQAVTWPLVQTTAMKEHFSKTVSASATYRCPRTEFTVARDSSILCSVLAQIRRAALMSHQHMPDVCMAHIIDG
jgi:hypothetical protein